jgi:hypothetical protein
VCVRNVNLSHSKGEAYAPFLLRLAAPKAVMIKILQTRFRFTNRLDSVKQYHMNNDYRLATKAAIFVELQERYLGAFLARFKLSKLSCPLYSLYGSVIIQKLLILWKSNLKGITPIKTEK